MTPLRRSNDLQIHHPTSMVDSEVRQRKGADVLGLRKRQRDVIDVRDERTVNTFGFPTSCPECGGRGYLDHIDLIDRTQEQHCTVCGHKWEQKESELNVPV